MDLLPTDEASPATQPAANRKALPLHYFYDTSSSFYRVHDDHITEIAVAVEDDTRTEIQTDFVSQVYTPPPTVSLEDCEDFKKNFFFPLILAQLLQWIVSKTAELSRIKCVRYYPVLVAHKGFSFHYQMLISEVHRHSIAELIEGIFEKHHILLSDSILHVHELKNATGRVVSMTRGMSLDNLFKKHFPEGIGDIHWYIKQVEHLGKPHTALERAEKLRRIYTNTQLRDSIKDIPRHSYKQQLEIWEKSAERRKLRVAYNLKCSETKKLLLDLNISHGKLMACYRMEKDSEIDRFLRHQGVASKALRMKLTAGIKDLTSINSSS